MMDFNSTLSGSSISDGACCNTFSITSLVREEVQNILKELSISDQFNRKEEIDDLIERVLKQKNNFIEEIDDETSTIETNATEPTPSDTDTHQQIEVTVEMLNKTDKNKLIVENFQILEQRITNLEERISSVLHTLPKHSHMKANKIKINAEAFREELRQFMVKIQPTKPAYAPAKIPSLFPLMDTDVKEIEIPVLPNPYDVMYYEQRQYAVNMLKYKKSKTSMELNYRPKLNPFVRPMKNDFPMLDQNTKPKTPPRYKSKER